MGTLQGGARLPYDGLNTGVQDMQSYYDSFSGTPTNREGFNKGLGYQLMSPTFVNTFNSGIISGGTSQSNYNSWSYSPTLPALTYGTGNRYVFWMTGTRDANGAIANSRPPVMTGTNGGMTIGGTQYLTANWDVYVEGHSDYNNLIIGGVQTDATGLTTFTLQMDYTISIGGSDYMFLIVIDGITSIDQTAVDNFDTRSSTSLPIACSAAFSSAANSVSQLRMVGGSSSNSGTANPTYTISSQETTAGIGPYTLGSSGENGTSERYGVYYDWDQAGGNKNQSLNGTVQTSTTASTGLGMAAAIVNMS